jgi:hypothetical protein
LHLQLHNAIANLQVNKSRYRLPSLLSLFAISSFGRCLIATFDKADSVYYFRAQQLFSSLTADRLATNSHSRLNKNSRWFSLYILGTGHTESTFSNNVSNFYGCRCLAMGLQSLYCGLLICGFGLVFAEPLRRNSCLFWRSYHILQLQCNLHICSDPPLSEDPGMFLI